LILTEELRHKFRAAEKARVIPLELTESLPCPRRVGNVLVASCFYYGRHYDVAQDAALIYVPSWGADFDWSSGELTWIGRIEGAALGFTGTRFDPIGEWNYQTADTEARQAGLGSAVERSAEINRLYDILVSRWWNGEAPGPEAERFRRLFDVASIKILVPGYLTLSRNFFEWARVR
jgi:hypothetical protein